MGSVDRALQMVVGGYKATKRREGGGLELAGGSVEKEVWGWGR